MSLDIGSALQSGVDDLLSERGALFVAAFVLFGLVNAVVTQSLTVAFYRRLFAALPGDAQAREQAMQAVSEQAGLAVDVPLAGAVAGVLVLFLVTELLRVVAIRAFASGAAAPLPSTVTRDFGSTALTAVLAAVVTVGALLIGSVLFVIPGIVVAVLFTFVRQEVALNDSGVLDAVRNSVGLVSDALLPVTGLVVVLFVLGIVVTLPLQFLPVTLPPALTTVVTTVLGQVVAVFGIAVVTDAYRQVTADPHEDW
ncbi:hypothetical protein [Haloarcula litorea]|uniref:hypothetical protein n=1 Tax=Haloarcula litorea TaxID=3032579 RepID=UPI0023E8217F|nr:hypothetical protein [Halomicroarcula sp. GDY20]